MKIQNQIASTVNIVKNKNVQNICLFIHTGDCGRADQNSHIHCTILLIEGIYSTIKELKNKELTLFEHIMCPTIPGTDMRKGANTQTLCSS